MTEPAPQQGNNTMYAIVGILLLLLAAGGAYFMFGMKEEPKPAPPPPAPKRQTALAQPEIEIPEEVPDAGPPPPPKKVIIKWVHGSWDCDGQVNAAQAKAIVQENNKQVRNCYEHKLKANHNLQGHVMLTMKIDKNGSVAATKALGSLGDNEVFACVQRVASTWRFPAPSGGACAVVQAPFNFTPQQ